MLRKKVKVEDAFKSAIRNDTKSTKKRDEMRGVAKELARNASAHVRNDSWRTRIDTNRKLERMGMAGVGHTDTWQNSITALGTSRDKRIAGKFLTNRVIDLEAEDIWRGDDMAGRAVETVPNQIVRAGFEILIKTEKEKTPEEKKKAARLDFLRSREGNRWWMGKIDALAVSPEQKRMIEEKIRTDLAAAVFPPDDKAAAQASGKEMSEAMNAQMDDLGVIDRVGEAMKAERGYGGSALFPGIIDGVRDLSKPLNLERIRSVDWLDVLTPLELVPFQWYDDPVEKNYGEPEIFWMQRISIGNIGSTTRIPIHESRLIRFPGIVVSRRQLREHWGWGDSVLVRMMEVLRDFQTSWQGASSLLSDFAQAVLSIKGLADSFASGEEVDKNLLAERAAAMDYGRSVARAIIIDAEETFERTATPLSGMADLLDRFCNRLAAAAHLPVTLLMGQSPAGLNATGDSDIRSFYDNVGANRERQLKPRLSALAKMLFAAKSGPAKGTEPEKWSWKWGPLWQPTELEEAQRRLAVAQADQIYIAAQVLIPEEVAISHWGGDAYSPEIHLDRDVREAADEQAAQEADDQAKQMQQQIGAAQKTAMVAAKTPAAGPNIHIHPPGAAGAPPGGTPKPGVPAVGTPKPGIPAKPGAPAVKKDDDDGLPWTADGNLPNGMGIKRGDLPQIVSQHMPDFLNGLRARGVIVTTGWNAVGILKPMQSAIQPEKVKQLLETLPPEAMKKPIVVSNDGFILDGHHRWAALRQNGPDETIQTNLVNLPATELIAEARAFPKAEYRDADWDEDLHPRDERGRFGEVGGPAAGHQRENLLGRVETSHGITAKKSEKRIEATSNLSPEARAAEMKTFVEEKTPIPPADAVWHGTEVADPKDVTWSKYMSGTEGKPDAAVKDPLRAELHEAIKEHYTGKDSLPPAGEKPVAIVMMGGSGSGKSSLLNNVDMTKFVHVDPDGIKEKLPEFRDGVSSKLMSAAASVHDESSHVAMQLRDKTIAEGRNIVYDGTGANQAKYGKFIDRLKEKGYAVEVRYSHLPIELATPRIVDRAERSGRWVPRAASRENHEKVPRNFEHFAGKADRATMFSTDVPRGADAREVWSFENGKSTEHDPAFVAGFKERYR